jgi:hypothetical protein
MDTQIKAKEGMFVALMSVGKVYDAGEIVKDPHGLRICYFSSFQSTPFLDGDFLSLGFRELSPAEVLELKLAGNLKKGGYDGNN